MYPDSAQNHLLITLEQLLTIDVLDVKSALDQASDLVGEALKVDKIDTFVYDPTNRTLIARGTSNTPLSRLQLAIGLNYQPLANGGRAAEVFQTGQPWHTGHADEDPQELLGVKQGLGVRSEIVVPLDINGERRGVVAANDRTPDKFTVADVHFLAAVAGWIGIVLHRAELMEQSLHEATEQARRLAADELVTILAHDLRAPLTPLRGRLEMLQRRAEREGQRAYLHDATAAERALRRVEQMISDLLDMARLEQGIFALNVVPVDLAGIVRETAETLRTTDSDIEIRVPEELPVDVDPQRMRQALENLLSNARTHSPEGAPVVVELATEQREDSDWVILSVRDAGSGIAPDLLPNLFTRFTARRGTRGLGLGLYLTRGIAEAHGGTITAESLPGQGATFRLAIPIQQERA